MWVKIEIYNFIGIGIVHSNTYLTNSGGTGITSIDENNNFVDFGTFGDSIYNALSKVYGLVLGKDENIYLTLQNSGNNNDTQIWRANLPPLGGKVLLTKISTGVGQYNGSPINPHTMDISPDGNMYMLD